MLMLLKLSGLSSLTATIVLVTTGTWRWKDSKPDVAMAIACLAPYSQGGMDFCPQRSCSTPVPERSPDGTCTGVVQPQAPPLIRMPA